MRAALDKAEKEVQKLLAIQKARNRASENMYAIVREHSLLCFRALTHCRIIIHANELDIQSNCLSN